MGNESSHGSGKHRTMNLNLRAIAENARRTDTETLLDRVTVFRADMEPAALDLIEAELSRRGISRSEILAHREKREDEGIVTVDGTALRCSYCEKPATHRGWGWHRLAGRLPVFPWWFNFCPEHRPKSAEKIETEAE